MDHGDVGSILLKRWNFPGEICDLVAMDHKSDVPEKVNDADVAMLHIADILSKEAGMGVSESITSTEIPESDLAALGIDKNGLASFRDYLTEAKDGIYSFYSSLG
jgi:HD-like signal output (HDOD) protein